MGGGSLSVVFATGPIRAHLDAYASLFMVWNPFHFTADFGVSVGVGFHGKVLFWTVTIEVSIVWGSYGKVKTERCSRSAW